MNIIKTPEELRQDFIINEYKLLNFINLSDDELKTILEMRNHKNTRKWVFDNQVISLENHLIFVNNLKNNDKDYYWLVRNNNGDDLGVLSLTDVNFLNSNCYIGIYKNPFSNHKGVANQIFSCAFKIVFDLLNFNYLYAEILDVNEASKKVFFKAGFELMGKLNEFVLRDGNYYDLLIVGIKKEMIKI